jgi:ABC-2 type transport system permease protein
MGGPPPTIELRADVQYNVSLTSRAFTISAQVGFIVYQVALTVASVGLARERELGTLEVLIVMPLRRLELIAGKAIPAVLVAAVNFGLMLGVVVHGLGIPMRGSLGLLVGLTVLFSVAEVSYGLLISSVAGTQQQAILFVFVLAMLDMAFSGYLVRVENLPPVLRMVSRLVPLSHYLAIVRGIMLKGAGIGALWPHGLAIAGAGILVMVVAGQTLERHAT